jgi:hypothetical protein
MMMTMMMIVTTTTIDGAGVGLAAKMGQRG